MREVEQSGAIPDRIVLLEDARVLNRHLEAAERDDSAAECDMFVVECRPPQLG
jgi:hypothetical protein